MKSAVQIESAIWENLHEYSYSVEPYSLYIKVRVRTLVDVLDDDVPQKIIDEVERLGITL